MGLDVVRAGDHKDGEVLSEPKQVLDAVRGFAVKMNDVRGYNVPMAVALLQGRIQELAAKIQRCISERGAAETVHCLA